MSSVSPSPITPEIFSKWLKNHPDFCLFLDIDGTLSPFELNPDASNIPANTLNLLKNLQNINVPIAIVTGRSLAEARRMLHPLNLPIGATHGLEIALSSEQTSTIAPCVQAELPLIIDHIEQQLTQQKVSNFLLEKKPFSVALHYRQHPDLAESIEIIMRRVANHFTDWQLKPGKFVWEMLPKGVDKGVAVTAILKTFNLPQSVPYCPIFIGDDISDEAGFRAVQALGGIGIKVGEPIDYPSLAMFFMADIEAVTQFLRQIVEYSYLKQEPQL